VFRRRDEEQPSPGGDDLPDVAALEHSREDLDRAAFAKLEQGVALGDPKPPVFIEDDGGDGVSRVPGDVTPTDAVVSFQASQAEACGRQPEAAPIVSG